MKVKGFKKGSNMNFSNASGNGEEVEFVLSNGTVVNFTLGAEKTLIDFSDKVADGTLKLFVNGQAQATDGRENSFISAPIDTESIVEVRAMFNDGTVGGSFGEGILDLITALGNAMGTALNPSRITITDCADRVTFKLENFSSFYQDLVSMGNGNSILNAQYPEFLNFYFNVSAELIGGGSYTLPLSGDQVMVNSNGDRALFAGGNQSAYTDVENIEEVGYGEDFNGTFTVNITAEDGQVVVSQTINTPNYICDKVIPVDDSGKDGCTDSLATNYDPAANNDDGSCRYEEEEEEVVNTKYGCTDSSATNYDPAATNDDGSCSYYQAPENEYLADVSGLTAVLGLTNENYGSLIDDTIYLIQQLQEELETANANQEDGASLADLSAVEQELADAELQLAQLEGAEAMLNAVENTIDNIANAPCNLEDPATQATFTALTTAGVGADTIAALRTLCTGNDNITIEDVEAATSDLNLALGVIQDILGNAVPDSTTSVIVANLVTLENDIQAAIDALQANQEDGVSQADVAAAEAAAETDYNLALDALEAEQATALAAAEADYDTALASGLDSAESDYNTALNDLDAEYDAALAAAEADYDTALAAAQDASYEQGYGEGAASIDITSDNQQAIADAMDLLSAGDEVYDAIFGAGAASVTPEDGVSQADLEVVQNALDAANATIASGDTGEAYDFLMGELELAENQLADATATNEAYEVFIQGVDTSMSRLERFLTDSYSYEAYDRSSLEIPTNMQSENPNFKNQTPSMTSIYVGDGTDFGNTSTYNNNLDSQFGEFSGGGKKAKSHSSFAYMMGKANHMREGFMNYSGELPFSRMDGNDDDSNEEGFELTEGTKTGLWIFGGAVAAFGLYKVLKKK